MKRKLLILDLALLAAVIGLGMRLRDKWFEAEKREQVVLHKPVKAAPAPPVTPVPQVQPVQGATYAEVAQKMLFSKDRNPTVVVEVAPPKPMPALPVLHGVIDVGDGPTAIMSAKKGDVHRGFHAGEKVGEFKLLAVNNQQIELEWDGKKITKKLDELIDRSGDAPPAPAAEVQRGGTAPPPKPVANLAPAVVKEGPGVSVGADLKGCTPGDTSPPGTVKDGYKKVVTPTPFGESCRWEAVK